MSDHNQDKPRRTKQYADGWEHKLKPLTPFDVRGADSASKMLELMTQTSFGGRNLGEAAEVLHEMAADKDCFVVMTLSGAMTIAKMGSLIAEMIDQELVHAVVSTGALMCHGLVEQSGKTHFRYDPEWDDKRLYEAGYARVYDTLELEQNLDDTEELIGRVLEQVDPAQPFGSFELNRQIGTWLRDNIPGRGILQTAAEKGVPVYVPAFTDSELGIDVFLHNYLAARTGNAAVRFDPMRDMQDYMDRILSAKRLGIFTIGGGVPRNWAQQVGPLTEIIYRHTDGAAGGSCRFRYAVRICPEPTHWGGLSGCTYSEGISWGKFIPPEEGGRYAEVYCDATIAWPLLVRGVLERLGKVGNISSK